MFAFGSNHYSIFDLSPSIQHGEDASFADTKKPLITRAQSSIRTPLGLSNQSLLNSSLPSSTTSTKRPSRKRDFTIFVDSNAVNDAPTSKKPRSDSRKPLSIRTESANSTPAPSPRLPSTPFPISAEDPFWLDQENYDTHALPAPPVTPGPFSTTNNTPIGTGHPAPPPQEYAPRRSTRISRLRRTALPLLAPVNMALYEILGIEDWSASVVEIMSAYRDVVMKVHPDKVSEERREEATEKMQMVNGAKEVLIHQELRRKYHVDGILPWAA